MPYYIHASKFFLKNGIKNNGFLEINDNGTFGKYYSSLNNYCALDIVDYDGFWLSPGLIDTHIHGLFNYDVMDCDVNGLNVISSELLKNGVTSWLPTTVTSSFDKLLNVCETVYKYSLINEESKILGIHLEGPYLDFKHRGAQNSKYLCNPNWNDFEILQKVSHNLIRKITIAPELSGSIYFTKKASSSGVIVSLGHSSATYDQTISCLNAGASMFTHVFNGMEEFHHRNPGMVGVALTDNLVYDEIICDGHHNDPNTINLLIKCKGPSKIVLVTDCIRAGKMPDGRYILGELPVNVSNGVARLKEGNLAGSVLQLNEAIKNIVDWNIVSPRDAIIMASYTPAKSLNLDNIYGSISLGKPADFIILNPNMLLIATYLNGKLKYEC